MFGLYQPVRSEFDAFCYDGKNGEAIVKRCTGEGKQMRPVPPGLEVLGFTTTGVQGRDGIVPVKKGQWIIDMGDHFVVLDDTTFKSLFKDSQSE